MNSLRRMLRFFIPYRLQAISAMLLLLAVVVADLLVPRLTQRIIDQGIARQDLGMILRTSLLMLGVALLSALFAVGNTLLAVRVAMGVSTDIRSALVCKVQTFSFGNLDRLQTGQLLVRATSDVSQVQTVAQLSLRMMTRAPLWVLGSVIMLVATSRQLALLMLGLLPVIGLVVGVFLIRVRPLFVAVQKRLDRLNQVLQENLAGVRVVKAFVRVEHENRRFDEANRGLTTDTVKVMQWIAILVPTMTVFVDLAIVGVVWLGGKSAVAGDFTLGEIVASVNYMTFSLFPLMMLAGLISPIAAADASAGRIWEVLDAAPEVEDLAETQPVGHAEQETAAPVGARVAFEGVCFSYNGDCSEPVLQNIDLVAEPGQTVAILGATGSGKSSLVHLIPRFYDVDRGRVTLDGVDVRDIPLGDLRAQVSMALQETVLFAGSIGENIRYGRPEATEEEIVSAAMAAQAHDFIMASAQGYNSPVGQRGVGLSGGQRQRIAIARAILVQPRVLILDDSTSAVDVETEARIQSALEKAMEGRTCFIVAQRISTVLDADKIVVLDQGWIVAQGTHAELLRDSPIYREIYESQLGDGAGANG